MRKRQNSPFINGRFVVAKSAEYFDVVSPYDGSGVCRYAIATGDDVDIAVAAARRAFDDGRWAALPPSRRKAVLLALADLIEQHGAEIDAIDAVEMGKPVSLTLCNALMGAGYVRFCAESFDKIMGNVLVTDTKSQVMQRRVPYGVVAGVASWNFPFYVALLKAIPAIAAGNSVVLKPSEISPGSALRLAELASYAGLPPGILNVLPGNGVVTGRALGLHPDVDLLTFTGSTGGGKAFMTYAGQSNLKKVLLECGGKSPQIVFDDGVDLGDAADAVSREVLTNSGQWCSAGTRLLVQSSAAQQVSERIVSCFKAATPGDPRDPQISFGPLASASHLERVNSHVERAIERGAHVLVGGKRTSASGLFFEPTLLCADVSDPIFAEEVFGPVLVMSTFEDEAEAIALANATDFGLYAYLWSARMDTALRVATSLKSSVTVRRSAVATEGAGFAAWSEPAGQSGIGVEGGIRGLESYLRDQLIALHHG